MNTGLPVAPALLFAGLADTTVLAVLVLATALLVVAGWAHWRFWQSRLALVDHYDEVVDLRLGDGITVQLRRLQPTVPSAEPPVLMVHGIAIDHRNLDVLPTVSLPRHLRAAGRDVWLLTLRSGMGLPRKQWPHIRFSRMVRHDLPEAIAEVLRRTGQSQLDYLGFSMGGMLAYAALGRTVPAATGAPRGDPGVPGQGGPACPGPSGAALVSQGHLACLAHPPCRPNDRAMVRTAANTRAKFGL
jgi:predicted alpha/beta-fold hydrolase